MKWLYYGLIALTVLFFGTLLGLALVWKNREPPVVLAPIPQPPFPPVVELPSLGDASVPVQGFVPIEPVIPADLYVDRMRALRRACPARFSVIGVPEGIFGECWDPQADRRLWAEWVALRAP